VSPSSPTCHRFRNSFDSASLMEVWRIEAEEEEEEEEEEEKRGTRFSYHIFRQRM